MSVRRFLLRLYFRLPFLIPDPLAFRLPIFSWMQVLAALVLRLFHLYLKRVLLGIRVFPDNGDLPRHLNAGCIDLDRETVQGTICMIIVP